MSISSTLGELMRNILYSESGIIEKNKAAFYIALVQSEDHDFEEIKDFLINKGAALEVKMLPLE